MKISLVQFIMAISLASISFANNADAQEVFNRKITIKVTDEKLKTLLNQFEKIGNVKFFYSPQVINSRQKVSLESNNQSIGESLERL